MFTSQALTLFLGEMLLKGRDALLSFSNVPGKILREWSLGTISSRCGTTEHTQWDILLYHRIQFWGLHRLPSLFSESLCLQPGGLRESPTLTHLGP